MPTRPTTGTNITTLGNFKVSNNINIPKNDKLTSLMNYYNSTYCSEQSYMPPSSYVSTNGYDFPTCGMSTKDVILAGSFNNNKTFGLNFEPIQYTKFGDGNHLDRSDNCFGSVVGRGRGRLNVQDPCKNNHMRYYR